MKEQIIRRFGNKRGMTFVELLVALTLLMVIILAFTPMLLYSYNNIYKAGEINELTYDAKSDVEKGLATRITTNILNDYSANFENLGMASKLNLRRIISNVKANVNGTIETLFYNGKGSIRIVSAQTVNDDTDAKKVVIQAKGIIFDRVVFGNDSTSNVYRYEEGGKYVYGASIQVYAPNDKGATENEIYTVPISTNLLSGETDSQPTITNNSDGSGMLITIIIKGQDLTKSPLKIVFNYIDENNIYHTGKDGVSTYLYIDPPTMILAGATSSAKSYYTSAGVVNGTLQVEGRLMSDISVPDAGSTELRSIKWISNDTTTGYGAYYVLTGTNGTILRLYRPTAPSGLSKFNTDTSSQDKFSAFTFTDGGVTKVAYPVTWSGDFSHNFGYSSYEKSLGYGLEDDSGDDKGDNCWYTEDGKTGNGQSSFETQARFAYYYSGYGTNFAYNFQNSRTLSYILTESGYSLRIGGCKKNWSDYLGFTSRWEDGNEYIDDGKTPNNERIRFLFKDSWFNDNYTRLQKVVYIATNSTDYLHDNELASIRLKSMNSYIDTEESLFKNGTVKNKDTSKINADYAKKVNITDAVYLPSTNKMFYTGNVSACAYVQQLDNISSEGKYAELIGNKSGAHLATSSFTGYLLIGSDLQDGTKVYKAVESDKNSSNVTAKLSGKTFNMSTSTTVNTDASNRFFVDRTDNNIHLSDLSFTFGYSSNREIVFSNITYDGATENFKSYEDYYSLSHYGKKMFTDGKTPNYYMVGTAIPSLLSNTFYLNSYNNDYYNVWFPGEYYNLIKTATKEGVTVAVGYAVSGSTYQFINKNQSSNTSTALGSVYNDGVLAAMIDNTDEEFSNLLYFKDNDSMNTDYLYNNNTTYTSKSDYSWATEKYQYGTHARNSVKFTAVDLLVESTVNAQNKTATRDYYAYYGDSTGRVFRSTVATGRGTVSIEGGESMDDDGYTKFNGTVDKVNYISDLTASSSVKTNAGGNMEEVKLSNEGSMKTVFKEITNIVISESLIVISGKQVSTSATYVVVGIPSGTDDWTFEAVKILNSGCEINTACIMDNYYYFAGKKASAGFFAAISVTSFTETTSDANVTTPQGTEPTSETITTTTTIKVDCSDKVIQATGDLPSEVLSMAGRGAA